MKSNLMVHLRANLGVFFIKKQILPFLVGLKRSYNISYLKKKKRKKRNERSLTILGTWGGPFMRKPLEIILELAGGLKNFCYFFKSKKEIPKLICIKRIEHKS